jgi:hypothetical protein
MDKPPERTGGAGSNPDAARGSAGHPLHPLAETVAADPDKPRDTVVLLGYLGRSSKEGFLRIYLDLSFRIYYEVPEADVLHAQKADPAHEEEPTMIVIAATATLHLVRAMEATFLQGEIASAYPVGSPTDLSAPSPVQMAEPGTVPGPHEEVTYWPSAPGWRRKYCLTVKKKDTSYKVTYGYYPAGAGGKDCLSYHKKDTSIKKTYGYFPGPGEGSCIAHHQKSTLMKITYGFPVPGGGRAPCTMYHKRDTTIKRTRGL